MILPGYTSPKTVCVQCWRRLVIPTNTDWAADCEFFGTPECDEIVNNFISLSTMATEFLAHGGYYYSWEVIRQHVVNGYLVYQKINRDEVVDDKQCVCDMCWYLWIRCVGKRCPFKSGTIFFEDVNYKVFNAISRLGYSRVLFRGEHVVGQRVPYSMRIGSSHLSEFIEFCENKAQWLLPEGETDIVMSRGRVGRGYEQVGLDFVPGRDGVDLALPFNRHHLLFGRVPLKQPDQATFTFLKFENYGTEAFSDIVLHGIQYGLHVVKRDREEKMPSRRETAGKKIMGRFQELVQLIFEFQSLKPIIKHETMEQVMDRAYVKGVSYIYQVVKMTMTKLNSYLINPNSNPGPLSAIQKLYSQAYDFLDFLIHDPTMDHLDVRFGREVIFDIQELQSKEMIVEPRRRTVEEMLPQAARPRGLSDSMIPRVEVDNDTDGFKRFERL